MIFSLKRLFLIFFILFFAGFFNFFSVTKRILIAYKEGESLIILDRNGKEIALLANKKGNYSRHLKKIPRRFQELLIKKEDRFFYYHCGLNPLSIFEEGFSRFILFKRKVQAQLANN